MEENDKERIKAIHEFYQTYQQIQKSIRLRLHSRFDIYGNNFMEIWEYEGDRRVRRICKVEEESETECYRRALDTLIHNFGKELIENEKRAG